MTTLPSCSPQWWIATIGNEHTGDSLLAQRAAHAQVERDEAARDLEEKNCQGDVGTSPQRRKGGNPTCDVGLRVRGSFTGEHLLALLNLATSKEVLNESSCVLSTGLQQARSRVNPYWVALCAIEGTSGC